MILIISENDKTVNFLTKFSQIYAEGIYLLSVGAGVVNTTVVNNPEFLKLLPEGWGNKMESVINDAYIYGREGISRQVRILFSFFIYILIHFIYYLVLQKYQLVTK